jgi:hypothetical protein
MLAHEPSRRHDYRQLFGSPDHRAPALPHASSESEPCTVRQQKALGYLCNQFSPTRQNTEIVAPDQSQQHLVYLTIALCSPLRSSPSLNMPRRIVRSRRSCCQEREKDLRSGYSGQDAQKALPLSLTARGVMDEAARLSLQAPTSGQRATSTRGNWPGGGTRHNLVLTPRPMCTGPMCTGPMCTGPVRAAEEQHPEPRRRATGGKEQLDATASKSSKVRALAIDRP